MCYALGELLVVKVPLPWSSGLAERKMAAVAEEDTRQRMSMIESVSARTPTQVKAITKDREMQKEKQKDAERGCIFLPLN